MLLNQWARSQTDPVIMVGDYNFDYEVDDSKHDEGFDALTADSVFKWVRPKLLVRSQANERYNSVLDFVFVSGAARNWPAQSKIVVYSGDFPDDEHNKSDHRMVEAVFNPVVPTKDVVAHPTGQVAPPVAEPVSPAPTPTSPAPTQLSTEPQTFVPTFIVGLLVLLLLNLVVSMIVRNRR